MEADAACGLGISEARNAEIGDEVGSSDSGSARRNVLRAELMLASGRLRKDGVRGHACFAVETRAPDVHGILEKGDSFSGLSIAMQEIVTGRLARTGLRLSS